MKRLIFLGICFVLGLIIFGVIVTHLNSHTVTNRSGKTIHDVTLELKVLESDRIVVKRRASLKDGKHLRIRHGYNDTTTSLTFTMNQSILQYHEPYVDLWTGEDWTLTIHPGGSVTTEHN